MIILWNKLKGAGGSGGGKIPSQEGQEGKVLSTNGEQLEWVEGYKPNLFGIKTESVVDLENIPQKNWACISYDTQKKLAKADVPTAYEFIETKYKNVDGAMSEATLAGGKIQLYFNGYYYWTDGDEIKRSQYVDLSSSETWVDNIGWNSNLFLLEFDNVTYIVVIGGSYIYLLDTTGTVVKTEQIATVDHILPVLNQKIIVINNTGYVVYVASPYSVQLKIIKIQNDLTISEIFSLDSDSAGGVDTTFYKGITPSLSNASENFNSFVNAVSCGFNNKIYWARAGLVFWYDLETNTYDYYENILPYGCEVYYDYGSKYRDWGFRLFVYNEKLSILSVSSDGKTLYLMQLNNSSWELVKTIDISSNPIYTETFSNNICGLALINGYFNFIVIDRNNTQTYKDYKTTNFDVFDKDTIITGFTSANRLSDLIYNDDKKEYIYTNMLGQYVYTAYVLTVYTDTINGIDIKYYKNGDWKICTPDIAVGNDDNLQSVYEYLGYLNYWWIDTTNEQITLQRNSNLWTMMYVGDDYEDSSLPSGNYLPSKTLAEIIEIDTASITIANIKPNKNYIFTNNAITDITLTACEQFMEETTIQFTTGSSAPTLTDNSGLVWFGGIPTLQANTTYVIVIFNKQAFYQEN